MVGRFGVSGKYKILHALRTYFKSSTGKICYIIYTVAKVRVGSLFLGMCVKSKQNLPSSNSRCHADILLEKCFVKSQQVMWRSCQLVQT